MLPFSKMPNSWTLDDLKTLCRERVAENQRLEYKQSLDVEGFQNKRELLKDVTSLANASGGVIIYGIREEKDPVLGAIAAELVPLTVPDLLDRANRILAARIQPSCPFFLYQISDGTMGYYLIAYVPQSWQRPHAFQFSKKLDYYIRRNADNLPMTETEIRSMYQANTAIQQTLKQRYAALDLDLGTPIRFSVSAMPIVDGLRLLDPLAHQGKQLTLKSYVRLMNGSNYLKARVDRYEEVFRTPDSAIGTRLFPDGTLTFTVGRNEERVEVRIQELQLLLWKALKFFSDVYRRVSYYGQLRLWFELVQGTKNRLVVNYFAGPFKELHEVARPAILVPVETSNDELNSPLALTSDLVKYIAQACDYELDDRAITAYESDLQNCVAVWQ